MSRRLLILLSALAVALAAAFGYLWFLTSAPSVTTQGKALIGGPFKLTTASGDVVDSGSLKGKPYVIFFGFTHCPEVCPTTLYALSSALKDMGDKAKDIRAFFVTVDPERDTAQALEDYMASFDNRVVALRPANADELAAITKTFRVFYRKVPTSDGSYTMDHTALVYLMDKNGDFFGTLANGEDAATMKGKLERLATQKSGWLSN